MKLFLIKNFICQLDKTHSSKDHVEPKLNVYIYIKFPPPMVQETNWGRGRGKILRASLLESAVKQSFLKKKKWLHKQDWNIGNVNGFGMVERKIFCGVPFHKTTSNSWLMGEELAYPPPQWQHLSNKVISTPTKPHFFIVPLPMGSNYIQTTAWPL